MQIETVKITENCKEQTYKAEHINYLSEKENWLIASALFSYIRLWDGTLKNKKIKDCLGEEDVTVELIANIENQSYHWGRKYYGERKTFADQHMAEIKKQVKTARKKREEGDGKYKSLPFIHIVDEFLTYNDGDYSDLIGLRLGQVYQQKNLFLLTYFQQRMIELQRKGSKESRFHKEFVQFASNFKFQTTKFTSMDLFLDEEKSSALFRNPHLEIVFQWINEEEKYRFTEINKDDLNFLLILGEIFTRNFIIKILQEEPDVSGVMFIFSSLPSFYQEQLIAQLKNIQFFLAPPIGGN